MVWWKFNNKCRHFPRFQKGTNRQTTIRLISFYMLFLWIFLYAFWRARKIVFIYWFLLVFIVNSFFFFFFFFFFWMYSLCEQLWFIFLEFNNLREKKRKEVGDKAYQCQEAECRYVLAYFGFGDCHGQWWTHGYFIIHGRDFQETSSTLLSFFSWHGETRNLHSTVRKSKSEKIVHHSLLGARKSKL